MSDQKPMMHFVVIALIIAVVVMAFNAGRTPVSINAQVSSEKDTITVSGTGEIEAMPDEAKIYVRIVNEGAVANDVQDENKEMTSNVISALKARGVKSEEIETSRYYLDPKYSWRDSERKIIGYEAVHVLRVTTDDIDEAGTLIDAAVGAGANSIDDIEFTLSDELKDGFYEDALEEASLNAKAKADTITKSLKVSLEGLSRVSESSVSYSPYRFDYAVLEAMPDMAAAGGPPTPISPEKVTVRASVTLVYEIS